MAKHTMLYDEADIRDALELLARRDGWTITRVKLLRWRVVTGPRGVEVEKFFAEADVERVRSTTRGDGREAGETQEQRGYSR